MSQNELGNGKQQEAEGFQGDPSRRGALAPINAGMPPGGPMGSLTMVGPRTDVIRGGMDGGSLYHAFRRRWLLATCMGLLAGLTAAGALWLGVRESSSAKVLYKVASTEQQVMGGDIANEAGRSFDIYRKTQVVQIRSPFVINAALKDPRVQQLDCLKGVPQEDRPTWLLERLVARFPDDSEILEISVTGNESNKELDTLVQAVSKAYYDEVVFREKSDRLKPRTILQQAYAKLDGEIRRKSNDLQSLRVDRGSPDAYDFDPKTQMLMRDVQQYQQNKAKAQEALTTAAADFALVSSTINDPSYLDRMVEAMLAEDEKIAYWNQVVLSLDLQLREAKKTSKRGDSAQIRGLEQQIASYQQDIAQYTNETKQRLAAEQRVKPDPYLSEATRKYQISQQMYGAQIKQADEQITKISEQLLAMGEKDAELAMRESELEQLSLVQQSIIDRIERWDIEAGAPDRIISQGPPEVTENINFFERCAIASLGALASSLLTALGIAYMEFRGRRLNGPEQVEEGLGIRVIGTLPSLSSRGASGRVLAQLQESIDSVRTALMHESTTKRRQMVLITSPSTLEGRTTVASQLAVSLARAGRRTLLVDGDLRSPSLHTMFAVPLEDGLCEVLRAEVDVTDVIHPTNAEGLWLLTAGFCDIDAVHALATDQVQPIVEKLRAEYDFIIVDGAPVLGLADSLLHGQHCDCAILSVLRDHTSVPKIQQASDLLRSVGIRLIGAVVNGVPFKSDRRVTHLQVTGSKSARKQLENTEV